MVLRLYSGSTCLRTIGNVMKVNQDERDRIIVTNRVDRHINFKTYYFNKDYDRFLIECN